jgi:hypothetical protein
LSYCLAIREKNKALNRRKELEEQNIDEISAKLE